MSYYEYYNSNQAMNKGSCFPILCQCVFVYAAHTPGVWPPCPSQSLRWGVSLTLWDIWVPHCPKHVSALLPIL